MPLSEHEQKMLEQMERALYAEDPRFASQMKGSAHSPNRRRIVIGVCGAALGLGLVLAGVATEIIALGVVGFVLMVAGVAYAATPARKRSDLKVVKEGGATTAARPGRSSRRSGQGGQRGSKPSGPKPTGGSFTERMENRWDKRREEGPGL